jgi:hypothetical protein
LVHEVDDSFAEEGQVLAQSLLGLAFFVKGKQFLETAREGAQTNVLDDVYVEASLLRVCEGIAHVAAKLLVALVAHNLQVL